MKALGRLLGATITIFLVVVFGTLTICFIRKVWFGQGSGTRGHVSVIDVNGVILSASDTLREIQDVFDSGGAKAIVVRINSPGGMVAPSQEIYEALAEADKKVPVIISMGAVAASGGYYLALGGRKLFAEPGTLTASIGVIMEFTNTEKLVRWAKVERFALTAGRLKDAGSPFRPMTPDEKVLFDGLLANIHRQFRGAVKERRKLTDQQIDSLADGRVMTGAQAYEAKLIDALGGFNAAVREAKMQAKLPDSAPVIYAEPERGLLRKLLWGDAESTVKKLISLLEKAKSAVTLPPSGWSIMLLSPVHG